MACRRSSVEPRSKSRRWNRSAIERADREDPISMLVDAAIPEDDGLSEGITRFLKRNAAFSGVRLFTHLRPDGVRMIPCDHTASSFALGCVEDAIRTHVLPYYANTHSNSLPGRMMSSAVASARRAVLRRVGGDASRHAVMFTGSGATGAINHMAHMIAPFLEGAVVVTSVLEHYSNVLPWTSKASEVVTLGVDASGRISLEELESAVSGASRGGRRVVVAVCAASNVTGVVQPVDRISEIARRHGAVAFVDCATSAPYDRPDVMSKGSGSPHAVAISPHKFPGGQSTPGVLVVERSLVCNPQVMWPGGGAVRFLEASGSPVYASDLEVREGAGTPDVVGIVRAGMAMEIGRRTIGEVSDREAEVNGEFSRELLAIARRHPRLRVLAPLDNPERLAIFPFAVKGMHYNLVVALLCDAHGVTARGGISCSAYLKQELLGLSDRDMEWGRESVRRGMGSPPDHGWVRVTLGPVHSDAEVRRVARAIEWVCEHGDSYASMYAYNPSSNLYESTACDDGICAWPKRPTDRRDPGTGR